MCVFMANVERKSSFSTFAKKVRTTEQLKFRKVKGASGKSCSERSFLTLKNYAVGVHF